METEVWRAERLLIDGKQVDATDGRTFENLYVLRFAGDGRCAELTEWYWQQRAGESDS